MPGAQSLSAAVRFGPHIVTSQVFHRTPLSFALVNIRPLLPGHVLICPLRPAAQLHELTAEETQDLFATVRRVQRTLRRVHGADGFNVAVQDGRAAGQSVAHVHCHVIPRREGDMDARGGGDRLYEMLDGEEGNVGQGLESRKKGFTPDAERKDRSNEEMKAEAEELAAEMERDER